MTNRIDFSRLARAADLNPTWTAQMARQTAIRRWRNQKSAAKWRGIAFELTFDQWMQWWTDSGHYPDRGKHWGEYVMARKGDIGAYAIDNIECIRAERNVVDCNARRQTPAQ